MIEERNVVLHICLLLLSSPLYNCWPTTFFEVVVIGLAVVDCQVSVDIVVDLISLYTHFKNLSTIDGASSTSL